MQRVYSMRAYHQSGPNFLIIINDFDDNIAM